jgi:hypothetical protein
MKRIVLSIAIATGFLIAYLIIAAVVALVFHMDRNVVATVDIPTRLPKVLYYYFYPPSKEDFDMTMTSKKWVLGFLFLVSNLAIYSLPVYGLLVFLGVPKRKATSELIDVPPSPPEF